MSSRDRLNVTGVVSSLAAIKRHGRKGLHMTGEGGDTLVEVLIATTILSAAIVGGLGAMNLGFGVILNSTERTQVQANVNSQLSLIQYSRDAYVRANRDGNVAGGPAIWQWILGHTNASYESGVCDSDGAPTINTARNPFYIDDTTLTSVQITSVTTPDTVATAGDGLWVEAVRPTPTTNYIDFYVKACWQPAAGSTNQESRSVIRLYTGETAMAVTPTPPAPLPVASTAISQIDVGNYHVCANSYAGAGYCWGKNDFGALGNGTNNNKNSPFEVNNTGVLAGKKIVGTSAGYNHTCVIDDDGRVYCWGYNSQGQLGNGASGTTNNPYPTAVVTSGPLSSRKVIKVNGGDSHTCAVTADGNVYCWGGNNYGQLGIGGTTSSFVPVEIDMSGVTAGKNFVDVSAGYAHTCALASDGTAYCWGFNGHGQLGDNSPTLADSTVPVRIANGLLFKQISAGDEHTCGVTTTNRIYCWGYNQQGQVGNGSLVDTRTPTAVDTSGVLAGLAASKVAAGYRHTCALAGQDAYCWGNNDAGQLGSNEVFVTHTTPVAVIKTGVLSGKALSDIATGRYSSCAVATPGTGGNVFCWGKNDDGQLGDGKQPVDSSVPSLVTMP